LNDYSIFLERVGAQRTSLRKFRPGFLQWHEDSAMVIYHLRFQGMKPRHYSWRGFQPQAGMPAKTVSRKSSCQPGFTGLWFS
jgi:hypothetical protein